MRNKKRPSTDINVDFRSPKGDLSLTGFTLIETLVTIVIFALMMGVISGVVIMLYRTQDFTWQHSQAIDEARRGIETMVKEIREARVGDDGAFLIEKAEDYEFIFYSDVDKDEQVERVRYFIKPAGGEEGNLTEECVSLSSGGSCSVSFSGFFAEALESAQIKVSVEGDLDSSSETAEVFADGISLGSLCTRGDCGQCVGSFQDLSIFDVTSHASDNSIQFTVDASGSVDAFCDWQESNHSLKVKFEFSWQETASADVKAIFKKEIINPVGWPISYPKGSEETFIISENVMNEYRGEIVFNYYDSDNNPLVLEDRMEKTARMHVKLIINIDPSRDPQDFTLESDVQIRNLKTNL
ncbi:prepilin-type N-terminal cleavage/methylation domain-containing protein [Patescibacteria group bacterium]|nr:prepilin-type N-terminal cleavage/methylation domain-containing protein [Patescibacteria group bacterium]